MKTSVPSIIELVLPIDINPLFALSNFVSFFFSFLGFYILFVFVYTFGSVINIYITCELFALLTYSRKDVKPTNIVFAWKRFESCFIRNSAGNWSIKDKMMHVNLHSQLMKVIWVVISNRKREFSSKGVVHHAHV